MEQKIKIEGIYDARTLRLLKEKGIKDFGFDFSPLSFNFIQEYVLLDELVPLLDIKDSLYLHFSRSNDPMIIKVLDDLKNLGIKDQQIFLNCDEWSGPPDFFGVGYFLNYHGDLNLDYCRGANFAGLVMSFSLIEEMHIKGILNNFVSNFYSHVSKFLSEDKKIIVSSDWNSNIFPTFLEYFDANLLSFNINSKVEVCYRNVDLKKLSSEMEMLFKSIQTL